MKTHLHYHVLVTSIFSTIYFIFPNAGTKILPIISLCILAYLERNRYANSIAIGLIFSAAGDVSLALDNGNFFIFVCGIVCFLIAHLFYIRAYLMTNIDFEYKIATGVVYICYYCTLMGILLPFTDYIMIPAIIIYGSIICAMIFLATNRYFTMEIGIASRTTALVGSLFFLASDSTLSLNLFRTSIPSSNIIIMVTYYIGQMFIAMSAKDPFRTDETDDEGVIVHREINSPLIA